MTANELLIDAFTRIQENVHSATQGLVKEQLTFRPNATANSIAWLVWHLSRVQDDHIADLASRDQVWASEDWYEQFNLPFDMNVTGYGQTSEDVAAVHASTELLLGYHDAVYDQTIHYLQSLTDTDFDTVIDTNWNPPVTVGVRLISIINDDLQHVGQAAYVRGLLSV